MRTLITYCDSHIFRTFFVGFFTIEKVSVIGRTLTLCPITSIIKRTFSPPTLISQNHIKVIKTIGESFEFGTRLKFPIGFKNISKTTTLAHFSHIFLKGGVMEFNST